MCGDRRLIEEQQSQLLLTKMLLFADRGIARRSSKGNARKVGENFGSKTWEKLQPIEYKELTSQDSTIFMVESAEKSMCQSYSVTIVLFQEFILEAGNH